RIDTNFISEFHIFYCHERLKVLRPSSEELGNRLQTPTLIGCMFLRNLGWQLLSLRLVFACFAAMSRALNYRRFW
ncbi:MAG: hypothetical protein ABIR26_04815, partial [Ramlibacter sp.]